MIVSHKAVLFSHDALAVKKKGNLWESFRLSPTFKRLLLSLPRGRTLHLMVALVGMLKIVPYKFRKSPLAQNQNLKR